MSIDVSKEEEKEDIRCSFELSEIKVSDNQWNQIKNVSRYLNNNINESKMEVEVMKNDIYKALLAVVTEYAEGRSPLVKYKEMNAKLISLVENDKTLFRTLGFNKG